MQIRAWQYDARHLQVLVHSSPAGDMRRPVKVRADLDLLRGIRQRLASVPRRSPPAIARSAFSGQGSGWLYQAGRALSDVLLPPPVFALLLQSLSRADPACLRVRLCLDGSLVDLPWEYLYRPDLEDDGLAGFLALDARLSLVREPPAATCPAGPAASPQRLVLCGSPPVPGHADQRCTLRSLARSLGTLADLMTIELASAAEAGFESIFDRPVSIFHFAGHIEIDGDSSYLVRDIHRRPGPTTDRVWEAPKYPSADGTRRLYVSIAQSEHLAALLGHAGARLAAFSACNSSRWPLARQLLRAGVPAVVGSHGPMSERGTAHFFETLYASLAVGLSLDEAVSWARMLVLHSELATGGAEGLALGERHEWGLPALYMPCGDGDLRLCPQGDEHAQRQADARWRRQKTIYRVSQAVGTTSGAF